MAEECSHGDEYEPRRRGIELGREKLGAILHHHHLEIGELAGVEIEALEFCFDAVKRNSLAADAEMNIIPVPGRAWCMQCSEPVEIDERAQACPKCGSYQLQVTGGDQMRIKELEVE